MEVVTTIAELRSLRSSAGHGKTIGFVPTMGYLHAGHISLVTMARALNDIAVVSIFVNPTQFGPNEDFSRYPRDTERDLLMLRESGVDWVFTPSVEEMYPKGYSSFVEVRGVTERLEGEIRPGHFRGVTTIVAKLFNIVQPTSVYFGQKDAQQVAAIRKMVTDLNFPVQIAVGETVREEDGLAMSSRNVYLSAEERRAALVLYRALTAVQQLWDNGERRGRALRGALSRVLVEEPLAQPDYVSVADAITLKELEDGESADEVLASLAVQIGKTRLIDNVILRERET